MPRKPLGLPGRRKFLSRRPRVEDRVDPWDPFLGLGEDVPTEEERAELTAHLWAGPMYERLDALLVTSALSVGRRSSTDQFPDPEYDPHDGRPDYRLRLVWPVVRTFVPRKVRPRRVVEGPVVPVPTTRTWVIGGDRWVIR